MTVEKIHIRKFKVIENFEAEFKNQHVLIVGENEKGKSSLLQFIDIALGGKKIPKEIEGGGEITFNKNGEEINVKVSFKEGKPILKVKGKGISIDNNKSAIAELFGATNFDPNEFVEWSKNKEGQKKQVEFFLSRLEPEIQEEIRKIEANIRNNYEDRAAINKDITNLKGTIAASKLHYLAEPQLREIREVDTKTILEELTTINEKNTKIISFREKMFAKEGEIKELTEAFEKKKKELVEAEEKLKKSKEDLLKGFQWLEDNKELDTKELNNKLRNATDENKNFNEAQKVLESYGKIETLSQQSGELTALIDSEREMLKTTIKQMSDVFDGVSYNEEEQLTYKGTPVTIENMSSSQIIEMGVKILTAIPNTGILLIARAESIGEERWKEILKIADENKLQVIAEEVRRGLNELQFEFIK